MLTVVLIVLNIILLGTFIVLDDSVAMSLFGAENPKAKGELLSLYLTAIGGCAVIYGLWLTYMKIGEQMRQNTIADKSNNDTRFGEAIGYLNSDNVGIAIGGAYTLYQLAKDDIRYVPIVANIFSEYLAVNSKNFVKKRMVDTVIDLLLRTGYSIFASIKLELHDTTFGTLEFQKISNVYFYKCTFNGSHFLLIKDCSFCQCVMNACILLECEKIVLHLSEISSTQIINKTIYTDYEIKHNTYFTDLKITTSKNVNRLNLYVTKMALNKEDNFFINHRVLIYTSNSGKIAIYGDKECVEFYENADEHKTPLVELMESLSTSLFEDDAD